jgi:hypothetical protein
MSYSIGVDLGGTNIKIVVISSDGNVLDYLTSDTADAEGSWARTIKYQLESAQEKQGSSASHIGLAAPGLAARDGRSIAYMQGRLRGLQGFVWQNFLERHPSLATKRHKTEIPLCFLWHLSFTFVRNFRYDYVPPDAERRTQNQDPRTAGKARPDYRGGSE